VPETDHAIAAALSPDGNILAHASREEIVITKIRQSERLRSYKPKEMPDEIAFHPSGDWLVAGGDNFGLIAIHELEPWRKLYVGGRSNVYAIHSAIFQAKMRDIDFDEIERRQRASMGAAISQMLRAAAGSKKSALSQEQIEAMKREMEKQVAEMTLRLREMKEGRLPPTPPQARERVMSAGFSRDGRWLWCGTNAGLRVYEWVDVPRTSGADMPMPKWAFEPPSPSPSNLGKYVYAIAEEREAAAIVFGGITGRVYRLDLISGETRELLKLADETAVIDLKISSDGKALGMSTCRAPSTERRHNWKDERAAWSVWSYPRLKDSAVPSFRVTGTG
jgi:hypothetical protein